MARRRASREQDWRDALTATSLLALRFPDHRTPPTPGVRRKLRLVLCGAARTVWDRLPHDDLRRAVEVAERFADHLAGRRELDEARQAVARRLIAARSDRPIHTSSTHTGFSQSFPAPPPGVGWQEHLRTMSPEQAAAEYAVTAAGLVRSCCERSVTVARVAARVLADVPRLSVPPAVWETAALTDWHGIEVGPDPAAAVVRDLFGGPTPVKLANEWKTPTVVAIARGIAADGAFDRLPVLADALEDAGCESLPVLAHCRRAEPHWRGCWVVDGVLEE
jgi:hypothetical protein